MGCLTFDSLPTSLFCHRLDNMHWTESQQLLMEVQSVSRWTPALRLTLPSSGWYSFLDVGFYATEDDAETLRKPIETNAKSEEKGTV